MRGSIKGFDREALPKFQRRFAVVFAHTFEHRFIVCRINDDGDRFIIFRAASNHRRAADVNILNCLRESYATPRDCGFERIKIDRNQVDWIKTAFTRFCLMFSVAALVEKSAMHAGMQSFYTAFEHFRKCCETRYLAHGNFFLPQQDGCSTCGNDVYALALQRASKRSDAVFVRNGNDSAANFH